MVCRASWDPADDWFPKLKKVFAGLENAMRKKRINPSVSRSANLTSQSTHMSRKDNSNESPPDF